MSRFILVFAIVCGFNPFAFAQTPDPTPVQLSWEEIESPKPAYPFEAELNACIGKDIGNRRIGERCLSNIASHCPQSSMERPGPQSLMACTDYFRQYWQKRLNKAHAAIVAHYEESDRARPNGDQRTRKLRELQDKWSDWRQAKCDFLLIQTPWQSPWTQLQKSTCQYELTATRALELEQLQRELTD